MPFGEKIVHQLRHRTVNSLHHRAEVLADAQVTLGVIVIVEQGSSERGKPEVLGPMVEPIPEDGFGFLRCEGAKSVATARRDEVDGVVAVPVLERLTGGVVLAMVSKFSEAPHA